MTRWVVTTTEVAGLLGKSTAATKVWLHRHGLRQVEQRRYPRARGRGVDIAGVYDGGQLEQHRLGVADSCSACTASRRRVTSIDSGRGVSTPPPHPTDSPGITS